MRYASADLPGVPATLGTEPEDFVVDEVPLYEPSGTGSHTYLTIEKRNLTTFDAVSKLAQALGVEARDLGTAGLKDRRAVTRQRISIPGIDPERALALVFELPPGQVLRVLEARRHGNKLKTGHLTGNRFRLRMRVSGDPAAAAAAAQAILERLQRVGVPNYYGEQRFGNRGDNAERGRAILAGRGGGGPPKEKRLMLSALQSHLFNRVLDARMDLGPPRHVLPGDVMVRPGGHATFLAPDPPTVEQARANAGDIVPTGPMFGPQMTTPTAGSPAALLEEAILAEEHLTLTEFGRVGRLAEGTRREAAIAVQDVAVTVESGEMLAPAGTHEGHIIVSFGLPRGAYATVVLAELTKPTTPIAASPEPPPAEVP